VGETRAEGGGKSWYNTQNKQQQQDRNGPLQHNNNNAFIFTSHTPRAHSRPFFKIEPHKFHTHMTTDLGAKARERQTTHSLSFFSALHKTCKKGDDFFQGGFFSFPNLALARSILFSVAYMECVLLFKIREWCQIREDRHERVLLCVVFN